MSREIPKDDHKRTTITITIILRITTIKISVASRHGSVPFEWYGRQKKCAQNLFLTFLLYAYFLWILNKIVYEYFRNKNLFKRPKYTSPKVSDIKSWMYQEFQPSPRWKPRLSLNRLNTNFKKTACRKNVWMQQVQW